MEVHLCAGDEDAQPGTAAHPFFPAKAGAKSLQLRERLGDDFFRIFTLPAPGLNGHFA
jgi:hypothetical protein